MDPVHLPTSPPAWVHETRCGAHGSSVEAPVSGRRWNWGPGAQSSGWVTSEKEVVWGVVCPRGRGELVLTNGIGSLGRDPALFNNW